MVPFAATRMDLEIYWKSLDFQTEKSDREGEISYDIYHMHNLNRKYINTNKHIYKPETDPKT